MAGDDVYALQRRLLDLGFNVGRVDGYFGPETEGGVREFQRNFGIPPDGTCGPSTLKALTRLGPDGQGRRPQRPASQERSATPVPTRRQDRRHRRRPRPPPPPRVRRPAAGSSTTSPPGSRAGWWPPASQAFLTAPRVGVPPRRRTTERAAFANRTGADLFLSLALDASPHPDACGVSSYFFGDADPETWSSPGERLAGLVQREIVARTDLVDLRTHPKTWELLRHTRMPAVRLDAGYLTHAADAARLADPELPRPPRRGPRGRGAALLPAAGERRPHRRAALSGSASPSAAEPTPRA